MMLVNNDDDALLLASRVLNEREVKTKELISIKKIPGSLRGKYLPEMARDYWIVTFRLNNELSDIPYERDSEEFRIFEAAAELNDIVAVAVEMDGTANIC
jgi:hypothetical protein